MHREIEPRRIFYIGKSSILETRFTSDPSIGRDLRRLGNTAKKTIINMLGLIAFVLGSMSFISFFVVLLGSDDTWQRPVTFVFVIAAFTCALTMVLSVTAVRSDLLPQADIITITRIIGTAAVTAIIVALFNFSKLDWWLVAALVLLIVPLFYLRSSCSESMGVAGPTSWSSLHEVVDVDHEVRGILNRQPWLANSDKHNFMSAVVNFPDEYIERRVRHFDIGREVTNCKIVTDFHVGRLKVDLGLEDSQRVYVPVWGLVSDDYSRSLRVESGTGEELVHLPSSRSQRILLDAAAVILAKTVYSECEALFADHYDGGSDAVKNFTDLLTLLLIMRNRARDRAMRDSGHSEFEHGQHASDFASEGGQLIAEVADKKMGSGHAEGAKGLIPNLLYYSAAPPPIVVPTSSTNLFRVVVSYEVDTSSLLDFEDAEVAGPINFLKKKLRQPAPSLNLYLESGVEPKDSACEVVLPGGSAFSHAKIEYDSSVVRHEWRINQSRGQSVEAFRSHRQSRELPGSGPRILLKICESGITTDVLAAAWVLFVLMFGLISGRISDGSNVDMIALSVALPVSVITVSRLFIYRLASTVTSSTAAKIFALYGGIQITAYYFGLVLGYAGLFQIPEDAWSAVQRVNFGIALICSSFAVVRFARNRRVFI